MATKAKVSTGIKAKQVANVLRRNREKPGMTLERATQLVTQHRLAGTAIGGYTVKSRRSGGSGGRPASKPASAPDTYRNAPKPVKQPDTYRNAPKPVTRGSATGSSFRPPVAGEQGFDPNLGKGMGGIPKSRRTTGTGGSFNASPYTAQRYVSGGAGRMRAR